MAERDGNSFFRLTSSARAALATSRRHASSTRAPRVISASQGASAHHHHALDLSHEGAASVDGRDLVRRWPEIVVGQIAERDVLLVHLGEHADVVAVKAQEDIGVCGDVRRSAFAQKRNATPG